MNKSHGIILNLVCASTDPSYVGVFRHFYFCLSSLDVVTHYKDYKDSNASGKRFVSNLRCLVGKHYKNSKDLSM